MSVPQLANSHIGFDEYLALEADSGSDLRHELVGGQMYAMAGATRAHNRVVLNLVRKLDDPAIERGCRLSAETVKLKISDVTVYYPDLMVVCGPPVHDIYEVAPCLVIEVLSPSTADMDRREKMAAYLGLSSLVTYLMIDSAARTVEAHLRIDDRWRINLLGIDETITLACPAVTLAVKDCFVGLD